MSLLLKQTKLIHGLLLRIIQHAHRCLQLSRQLSRKRRYRRTRNARRNNVRAEARLVIFLHGIIVSAVIIIMPAAVRIRTARTRSRAFVTLVIAIIVVAIIVMPPASAILGASTTGRIALMAPTSTRPIVVATTILWTSAARAASIFRAATTVPTVSSAASSIFDSFITFTHLTFFFPSFCSLRASLSSLILVQNANKVRLQISNN
mmetsp:Transcript_27420/g.39254  ORF Transcript_27420/g.39254 Transcript_27420/m.39254 type:complete len:206 (-) Transcript_27420:861-1478(-)